MNRRPWICAIAVGVVYAVVGIGLTELSNRIATDQFRAWRLAAWVVSALVYAGHFYYEQFRLKQRSLAVALHLAIAVGIGAFLLAVGAAIHATFVVAHAPWWLFGIALVAWPLLTGLPAFVVALLMSSLVTWFKRTRES
jgi:hypothetical protein